jgi:hypothetical protein
MESSTIDDGVRAPTRDRRGQPKTTMFCRLNAVTLPSGAQTNADWLV